MKPDRYGPFPFTPIGQRPKLRWPNGERLALWVIPNLEFFPLDEPIRGQPNIVPNIQNWSVRDYGAWVGVWRLMEVLSRSKSSSDREKSPSVSRDWAPGLSPSRLNRPNVGL